MSHVPPCTGGSTKAKASQHCEPKLGFIDRQEFGVFYRVSNVKGPANEEIKTQAEQSETQAQDRTNPTSSTGTARCFEVGAQWRDWLGAGVSYRFLCSQNGPGDLA